MAELNQSIVAIITRVPWVYAIIIGVAAVLVMREYIQTRLNGALLVAIGLILELLGLLAGLIRNAVAPSATGSQGSLTPGTVARANLVLLVIVLSDQLLRIPGVALIVAGTVGLSRLVWRPR